MQKQLESIDSKVYPIPFAYRKNGRTVQRSECVLWVSDRVRTTVILTPREPYFYLNNDILAQRTKLQNLQVNIKTEIK